MIFVTFADDDPDEALVLDSSRSLRDTLYWMHGRGDGYVYRLERLPDGAYGNDMFIGTISALREQQASKGQ